MTNKEAINLIQTAKAEVEWEYPLEYVEAFDKAVQALDKQVPREPVEDGYNDLPMVCPHCGEEVRPQSRHHSKVTYCKCCGQALSWEDE